LSDFVIRNQGTQLASPEEVARWQGSLKNASAKAQVAPAQMVQKSGITPQEPRSASKKVLGYCRVNGCANTARYVGLCQRHHRETYPHRHSGNGRKLHSRDKREPLGRGVKEILATKKRDANDAAHRRIFREQNGSPPWACAWCKGPVYLKTLNVHHVDGEHANNNPRNLVAVHKDCHWATHDAEQRGANRARAGIEVVNVESL